MRNAIAAAPLDAYGRAVDGWTWFARVAEIVWTRHGGVAAIETARRKRFGDLVRHARARSPFYRELYGSLTDADLEDGPLPVVHKCDLMRCFDAWVTDPRLTRAGVERFLADPARIGERHLGRYVVWKSSGSTGEPGIFVQDDASLATYDALLAVEEIASGAALACTLGVVEKGGRAALVTATGDHYASIASWRRAARGGPWPVARTFSITTPLPELVTALNAWDPAFVASYPTMLSLLADEKRAGRLAIAPVRVWSGGERLAPAVRIALERAFGCPVANEYGASECFCIASGCRAGWLHVNADWVMLEPVDRDYRPTQPGVASHTVLLTNLANQVQPLIRYDLGDSVVVKPGRCACGSPLPAIAVEGRCSDVLSFDGADGATVRVLPLALETVVEQAVGMRAFQIARGTDRLLVRLANGGARDRRAAWSRASAALRGYLDKQGLGNVRVVLDPHTPAPDPGSGKLRHVIAAPRGRGAHASTGARP